MIANTSSKKRILITSMHFYPEQFRINDIALELKNRGHHVEVITGIPNYPQGKFYKGYGMFKRSNGEWNGINATRLAIFPRGRSKFTLALNYLSYIISGFFWAYREKREFDLVFVFATSPIFQALPAIWYSKRKKIPCHVYVQDLWPESLIIAGGIKNSLIIRLVDKVVRYIYGNATYIFATSSSMAEEIRRKCDPQKVIILPQYAEEHCMPCEPQMYKSSNVLVVTYAGNVGFAQGLDVLPKAAKILKGRLVETAEMRIVFRIVGDGRYKEHLQRLIEDLNVEEMFRFDGYVQSSEVPKILAESSVAFLSYKPDRLLSKYIPAKLQTYMACAKPILAVADGETKKIIESARCGMCAIPGDAEDLAEKIEALLKLSGDDLVSMGINARRYYEMFFDKKITMSRLEKYIMEVQPHGDLRW